MAKKYNRDMPLPSSDGMFGGPGKGGPGKGKSAKPSNPFSATNFSFEKPVAPRKETFSENYDTRKVKRDSLNREVRILRDTYTGQNKSTTMSFGKPMSEGEYKKKLKSLHTQIQGTRKGSDKLYGYRTKLQQAFRSKRRKGSGSYGSCSMTATTKSASCSKARKKNSSVGGKF